MRFAKRPSSRPEAGGITQHIGAYQAQHDVQDHLPGHAGPRSVHGDGAPAAPKVTDIAVLVVAADDGVMPQTQESIAHARAAEVSIVVAREQIDRARPRIPSASVKSSPARISSPEDGDGIDTVLGRSARGEAEPRRTCSEKVLLVADAELRAEGEPERRGVGPESSSRASTSAAAGRDDARPARQRSTSGDRDSVAGDAWGKVRALPHVPRREGSTRPVRAIPVEIIGFDQPPAAGDFAASSRTTARRGTSRRCAASGVRREQLAQRRPSGVSLDTLFSQMQEGAVQDLNLVIKADVDGSVEAAVSELQKIQHPEVRVNVIHTGVGGISENDVMLATASNAMIVGFNVRPSAEARGAGRARGRRDPDVQRHLPPDRGHRAGARRHAEAGHDRGDPRRGRGAGALPRLAPRDDRRLDGHERRRAPEREGARRPDGTVIYDTTISQLKRFKDDVREVEEGFECGILLDGFNDVKEGDVLEVYEVRQVERDRPERRAGTDSRSDLSTGYVGILHRRGSFPAGGVS
jgi:translation initiation factor IF-2